MSRLLFRPRLILCSIVCAIAFIIIIIKVTHPMKKKDLRVAYLIDKTVSESAIDPAKIELVKQANLVRSLYGRLIEFSENGSITPSLAESLNVNGNVITFKIRNGLFAHNHQAITAKDAAYSFKRLLVLKSNLHASLEQFLCEGDLHSVEQSCPGIEWHGSSLILKTKKASYVEFLIPLLANVDFSIIPYGSIDWGDKNLKIIDYKNTSGAYFVEKDYSSENKVILKRNDSNPNLKADSAERIILIKAGFDEAASLFKDDKVDLIPTIYQYSEQFLNETEAIRSDIHKSMPVRIWFAKFFKDQNHNFTQSELKYIAQKLKSYLPTSSFDSGFSPTNQLFPTLSEADLTDVQKTEINRFWALRDGTPPNKKFRIWVPITKVKALQEAFKDLPTIEFYYDKVAPWNLAEKDRPNAYIIATDSTFFEDLSVINYNLSMGSFGYSKSESDKWINTYINTLDKSKRINLLKDLHFGLLKSLEVVPLGFTPYIAISRNGWKIKFSKYYAGSPLWSVTHD